MVTSLSYRKFWKMIHKNSKNTHFIKHEKSNNLASSLAISGCETAYYMNDYMNLSISWSNKLDVKKVGVAIIGSNNEYVFGTNTGEAKISGNSIEYKVKLNLGPGRYFITVAINDDTGKVLEIADKAKGFLVYSDKKNDVGGITRMKYSYSNAGKPTN
jgi:hypothetical protein